MDTIQVETMLLGWSRSHNAGSKITLQINDEDLAHFERMTIRKGKVAGQRLMAVFVEIGDDELPVRQDEPEPERIMSEVESVAAIARVRGHGKFPPGMTGLAVRWCQDENFHDWLAANFPAEWDSATAELAKTWQDRCGVVVKMICGVASRKELDTDEEARAAFNRFIREPYAAHRRECGLD